MKIRRQKKGFTIIELVIVIAVIAILSAVLIPTFVGLVRKANVAADTALVKNLNTVLASDKVVNGKHKTMYDALEVAKESGLDVSKLNSNVAKNEILWDSANDVFCYLDDGKIKYVPNTELEVKAKNVKAYEYYVIRDLKSQSDVSSVYSTYVRSSTLTEVTTTKGIDVGDNTTIESITYNGASSAQDVVIRTNSAKTSLTVNAANDTVYHYGAAGSVDVIAVANASYHENGSVAFLEIAKGRVALESTSKVTHIHISKEITSIDENGNKTKKDDEFDKIIVSVENGAKAPEFSRDEVSVDDIVSATTGNKGILVVEIEKSNDNSDFVYLFQQGLLGQVRVTTGASTNSGKNVEAKAIDETAKKGSDVSLEENTASIVVGLSNNLKDGSSATPDQIAAGTVEVAEIEEAGLSIEVKEEKKDALVGTAIIEEEREKENEQGKCLHNWFTKTIEAEATCLIGGQETQECSLCHSRQTVSTDPLGHDLIGIYCNRCKHPVAFVDEIDDYTVNDPNGNKMPVAIVFDDFGDFVNESNPKLYLDTAYSFKAFPDMNNKTLDDEKLYKLDLETFTFTEKKDGDSDELCFTAQGIYEFFSNWYCDYYVSFSDDVNPYTCGLGGCYGGFEVGFLAPDMGEGQPIPGNLEVPLLGFMINGGESNWTYEMITTSVGEFKCGFFNLSEDNVGKTFSVKLRILNPYTNDHSAPNPVEIPDLGITLPSYIDVAVTNYVIQAPSEENMKIVSEFLAEHTEYAESL